MFWLVLSLWLTAVILPAVIVLARGKGFKYLFAWEILAFLPLIALFMLVALLFLGSLRKQRLSREVTTVERNGNGGSTIHDLYFPKVDRDFYLPKWRK